MARVSCIRLPKSPRKSEIKQGADEHLADFGMFRGAAKRHELLSPNSHQRLLAVERDGVEVPVEGVAALQTQLQL